MIVAMYVALGLCTAAIFAPAVRFDFVGWDDPDLVVQNPQLQSPTLGNLERFWTHPYASLYTPLAYSAWWCVARLSGGSLQPPAFHALTVLLHVCAALLVFSILLRLVGHAWAALAGALLFALDPLQVEPVAWISGMNNVLAGALSLAAIRIYIFHTDRPPGGGRILSYWAALAVYLLALLAKPTAVVVPLILLLIDWGMLRRSLRAIARTALPFLLLAALFAILAPGVQPARGAPLWQRPVIAMDALGFYFAKLAWPVRLNIDYGRTPAAVFRDWLFIWTIPVVVAVAAIAVLARKRIAYVVAIAIIAVSVLPVLGFVPFSFQGFSTVADRYLYLGMLGTALLMASWLARHFSVVPTAIVAITLSALGWITTQDLRNWASTQTLAAHALRLDPRNSTAHFILAADLSRKKEYPAAIDEFNQALAANPTGGAIHFGLGNAYLHSDQFPLAIAQYRQAIPLLSPESRVGAWLNLGIAYYQVGQPDLSRQAFERAIALDPQNAQALHNLRYLEKKEKTASP